MATSPAEFGDLSSLIHAGWKETGKSLHKLYIRYATTLAERGEDPDEIESEATFKNWVALKKNLPRVDRYEILEAVINGELKRQGKPPILPALVFNLAPGGGAIRDSILYSTQPLSDQAFRALAS